MSFPTLPRAARVTLATTITGAVLAATASAHPADVRPVGANRTPAPPPVSQGYLHYVSGHAPRDPAPAPRVDAPSAQPRTPVDEALVLALLGLLAVAGAAAVSVSHHRGSAPRHARMR